MNAAEVRRLSFVPVGRVAPLWWLAVAIALVTGDYLTGPYFQFPEAVDIRPPVRLNASSHHNAAPTAGRQQEDPCVGHSSL